MRRAALLGLAMLLLGGATAHAADEPDLVPSLDAPPSQIQIAPAYIDAFEEPGGCSTASTPRS
jgi:hypothetical protein